MMKLREQVKRPEVLLKIGLVFLVIASLSTLFLLPRLALSTGWTDGFAGLLYGISIGCMLLGIWKRNRRDCSKE